MITGRQKGLSKTEYIVVHVHDTGVLMPLIKSSNIDEQKVASQVMIVYRYNER